METFTYCNRFHTNLFSKIVIPAFSHQTQPVNKTLLLWNLIVGRIVNHVRGPALAEEQHSNLFMHILYCTDRIGCDYWKMYLQSFYFECIFQCDQIATVWVTVKGEVPQKSEGLHMTKPQLFHTWAKSICEYIKTFCTAKLPSDT